MSRWLTRDITRWHLNGRAATSHVNKMSSRKIEDAVQYFAKGIAISFYTMSYNVWKLNSVYVQWLDFDVFHGLMRPKCIGTRIKLSLHKLILVKGFLWRTKFDCDFVKQAIFAYVNPAGTNQPVVNRWWKTSQMRRVQHCHLTTELEVWCLFSLGWI